MYNEHVMFTYKWVYTYESAKKCRILEYERLNMKEWEVMCARSVGVARSYKPCE
jgi:hypothetical protein